MWLGRYQIVASLGEGATSEVFLAQARGPRGFVRTVVLKRMHVHHASDPAYVADFAREARAYARLDHPAIVEMYDFFEHDGRPVLVLEYVDGLSLHVFLTRLQAASPPLGDAAALYVMREVFAGLAAAHDARDRSTGDAAYVVHRDVTPSNVLLGWDGRVKLTDFGIAKLAGVEADTQAEGLIKGTFGYMAPEQLLTKQATARTDVYQACLLLRELLLGQRTFVRGRESQVDFLERLARPSLPDIDTQRAGVPAAVSEALRIGLRPTPADRTISAARIRDVLTSCPDASRGRDQLVILLASVREPRSTPAKEVQTYRASAADLLARATGAARPEPRAPDAAQLSPSSIRGVSRERPVAPQSPPPWRWLVWAAPYAAIAVLGVGARQPASQGSSASSQARARTEAPAEAPEPLGEAVTDGGGGEPGRDAYVVPTGADR
jgi:serine/threonine-protein kinase